MSILAITIVVYAFLEWIVGSKALEEVEGLDPMGATSNVWPLGNTFSSYFSILGIMTTCLRVSLCCMPSTLLGFST